MQINIENLVPITEANQNFSKVARLVDSNGTAVILKNNKPKYVLVDYNTLVQEEEAVVADQASVDEVANSILSRHLDAFKELAK
ncbi:type II toxin-antitoxin system Phd/YefM family antitoxin [Streptococcus sp. 121]|uniref:type II toxin-antitoxin system Phd/YefM family antitoxin n=1 Tax=Streptococcus sp. 121 TaxID=2797637 RepID=UPI0018F0E6CC|nr:type II toxin-antitoxin system Phd/YefM family antitoxin [Streptococcus sp. 121]MBJ6746368.1 type II toxin-antitoxin system Phd/YefM family antitoxin [Streptococcus sp. 121]